MSQPAPQEIEAKFLVGDPAAVVPLRTAADLSPGYALVDAGEVHLVDEYLDTPDLRLLRNGYGLRIRRGEGKQLVTLKSRRIADTASIFRRTEIEEPLAPDATVTPISGWPEPIMQTLLPLLNGATRLQPLCLLQQTRQKRMIVAERRATPNRRTSKPTPLAELSFDDVQVRVDGEGPPLVRYDALEIELVRGLEETELHAIVAALQTQLPMKPSPVSKLEHALDVISRHPVEGPENWQGLRADMHMAEACRLIWREQLTQMLLNEAGVRFSSNPEYVHDMRVATRRARAAAKLYGDYFRPKAIRRFLRCLRRTARLLGAVRDLDVAIGKLQRFGEGKRGANSASVSATLGEWRERRDVAHVALSTWFDSQEYTRFIAGFAHFCRSPGEGIRSYKPKPGEAPVPHQVRHVTPSMILNRFENIRSYETLFEGGEGPAVEVLHLLRIECKYLRYNLEFVANLLGPESRRLLIELRKLQEDLGDLNDAVVSKQLLSDAPNADSATVNGTGVNRYQRAQEKVIRKLSSQLEGDLRSFLSYRNRRRLGLAIAWI
jgi:CHAD domain-containing protein